MRLFLPVLVLSAVSLHGQQPVSVRVVPSNPTVIAHDTLRLRGEALDASGGVIPGMRIRFFNAGFANAGDVDSTGLVSTASVGTLPVTVIASVPGGRPVTQRVEVKIVAGPPRPKRV